MSSTFVRDNNSTSLDSFQNQSLTVTNQDLPAYIAYLNFKTALSSTSFLLDSLNEKSFIVCHQKSGWGYL